MTTQHPHPAPDPGSRQEAAGDPSIPTLSSWNQPAEQVPAPPRRPTQARLQTYFLRVFALSGSLADAAARTGVATRTVRRWRAVNQAFARRYEAVLADRAELLEDLAMRRARSVERRPVISRGTQVATVERHNDVMLMRVLARFDRLREREMGPEPRELTLDDLRKMSSHELVKLTGLPVPPNMPPYEALMAGIQHLVEMMQRRLPKESAFSGQAMAVGGGNKDQQNNQLSRSPAL